jgi:predicted TIM-barrel fold metal-dependent hydrolase
VIGIIDAHTHAFPPEMCASREDFFHRDEWFRELYFNPKALLTGEYELLESMDATGIERAIIAGFPWADEGLCREHNQWMAGVCARHPGRFSYLATVVPQAHSAAADAADAFAAGAIGIGELNADAQRFDLLKPDSMRELVEFCTDSGKPIMLHTSEPLGHIYPGKGTATPDKVAVWLRAFPDQPVVLAHWGGGLPFYELMPEIRDIAHNVVYDCAATTYLYDFKVFEAALALIGPSRVLFGSDFPVLGQRKLLARVRDVIGDETALEAILWRNAARFFGIDAEAGVG